MSAPTFPIDFKAIRIALVRMVKQFTTAECIVLEPNDQVNPRPALPYIGMKITTPAAKSGDDSATVVSGTIRNMGGQRKMSVSFQCYAATKEDAYNYLSLLQMSFGMKTAQAFLRMSGISVLTVGTVVDLSNLLQTGYEARAQMDTFFGIAFNLTEDLGSIETVEVDGTVKKEDGSTQMQDSFNVTRP